MDTLLWILQIILGIKLITVSYTHGFRQNQSIMQGAAQKMGRFSPLVLNITAVGTFLGTIGLILPGILKASNLITSGSAAAMSIMLLISIFFHTRSREKPKIFVSVILFAFAAFIAYGRWVLAP